MVDKNFSFAPRKFYDELSTKERAAFYKEFREENSQLISDAFNSGAILICVFPSDLGNPILYFDKTSIPTLTEIRALADDRGETPFIYRKDINFSAPTVTPSSKLN